MAIMHIASTPDTVRWGTLPLPGDRPVATVESDDILANQMKVSGPVLLKLVCTAAVTIITNTGDIVGQGIQPYIGHMLRVKINGDAPAEGGPGHA